jgi:uncharacterized SAM-binding protein YcdF (DUF218 family)
VNGAVDVLQTFLFDSTLLALLSVMLGVGLLYTGRRHRWGRLWLTCVVLVFWVLSTPVVGNWLASRMSAGFTSLTRFEPGQTTTALVVLGGGAHRYHSRGSEINLPTSHTSLRVLEAARVYRLMNDPWVVVTGGVVTGWPTSTSEAALMRELLVRLGIPADRILIEERSRNTHDHAIYVPELLRPLGVDRYVLVTSGTHMWRATLVFAARGVTVLPSLAADRADPLPGASQVRPFLPSARGLELTELVLHDLLGIAYYWARGWI